MVKKIITWVDLQGRYKITSPAYQTQARKGFSEDDAINWVWTNIVMSGLYGVDFDHPIHLVEDADQRARLAEIGGTHFRYGVFMLPHREGRIDKATGEVMLYRDARDGAWEMDVDGRPKVNMTKAPGVQMDYIRKARNKALEALDRPQMTAMVQGNQGETQRIEVEKQVLRDIPQTFDLTPYKTPQALKDAWPVGLTR